MASLFRPGSWSLGPVRLPEFGVTEKIQSAFQPNKPLTQSGGSNLFGKGQPQVLGTQTPGFVLPPQSFSKIGPPAPKKAFAPPPVSGGGGGTAQPTPQNQPN